MQLNFRVFNPYHRHVTPPNSHQHHPCPVARGFPSFDAVLPDFWRDLFCADARSTREERITAKGFNGVNVFLAFRQQIELAFEDIAIGDVFAREREFWGNTLINFEAFKVVVVERQAGVGGQLAGQLLDNKVGYFRLALNVRPACRLSA